MDENPLSGEVNDIAVIGMACWYPGARTLVQNWENILGRRRQFRRMLDGRLPLKDYFHPDKGTPDKTYGKSAAFIDGFVFDWVGKRIPKSAYDSTDIAHWLALDVAIRAVQDAGLRRETLDTQMTGVIVGNSLTGECSRAANLRLRWPYVVKTLKAAASHRGLTGSQIEALLSEMEPIYKSSFPAMTEDSLAGSLSNTIAGRIANYLDLAGGGYTVDGACSSSLIAVATAATSLVSHDLNVAIAGGVDISLDTVELIGFAKVGALATREMKVYDRASDGFTPGEGSGFVVLKRLPDAIRDGDRVYALLKGWGLSSDGKGGITAPSKNGQALALERAYRKAGYSLTECDFIEGHGTGTAVGDRTELEGIALAMSRTGQEPRRRCGMTSFKSVVGHTKAAAGIGAFIKAVIAVNRRVLPPLAGTTEPSAIFKDAAPGLYPILKGEVRPESDVLRAGVSAMGFGGINCHVTVMSHGAPDPRLAPELDERALLVSGDECELFVLSADDVERVRQKTQFLLRTAEAISEAEMGDLACDLGRRDDAGAKIRVAVLASHPDELHLRAGAALTLLESAPLEGKLLESEKAGVWIGNAVQRPRIGFLFPGQGSQKLNMGMTLHERHEWARDKFALAADVAGEVAFRRVVSALYRPVERARDHQELENWTQELAKTENAQPAICLTSLLWLRHLRHLGVFPSITGGHSLGELTALHCAGALDERTLIQLVFLRGSLMRTHGGMPSGTMASLGCTRHEAEQLIAKASDYVTIANYNAPTQIVISGTIKGVDEVLQQALTRGIPINKLPVSNAFHSKLVKAASEQFASECPVLPPPDRLAIPMASGMDGKLLEAGLDLRDYLSRQISQPIHFVETVRTLGDACDLLVEVGSGSVLTGLTAAILGENGTKCLPVEPKPGLAFGLKRLLAALYVRGSEIHWEALYRNRLIRSFIAPSDRVFIVNPCESQIHGMEHPEERQHAVQPMHSSFVSEAGVPAVDNVVPLRPVEPEPALPLAAGALVHVSREEEVIGKIRELIVRRTGFNPDTLKPELRLLDDLNLDSIKAGEIVGLAVQELRITEPMEILRFANATLEELTQALSKARYEAGVGDANAGEPVVQAVAVGQIASRTSTIPPARDAPSLSNPVRPKAPLPSALSARSTRDSVLSAIESVTGFSRSSMTEQSRLLDDLNLDSIKASEVVVSAARTAGIHSQLDPSRYVNATIADIISALDSLAKVSQSGHPAIEAPPQAAAELISVIANATAFPIDSIQPSLRPVDDLHLSVAQLRECLIDACGRMRIDPRIDTEVVAHYSVSELAQVLENMRSWNVAGNIGSIPAASWVRNFRLELVEAERQHYNPELKVRRVDHLPSSRFLVLADSAENPLVGALESTLSEQGAAILRLTFDDAISQRRLSDPSFSHIVAVFGDFSDEQGKFRISRINQAIRNLCALANVPPASAGPRRYTTLAILQSGDGHFGELSNSDCLTSNGLRSIAESLQLERADLRVRVLDFSQAVEPSAAALELVGELRTPEPFAAVGFDSRLRRRVPRLHAIHPGTIRARNLSWSADDVVLVTGGGKGITAECACAFAKKHGVALALVGRSLPIGDEIRRNLERLENAGIRHRYYTCDVADPNAVQDLVRTVEGDLGAITGIIHGAGINRPRRLAQVTPEAAFEEISPKLVGALSLLDALTGKPVKLVAALTSVIGIGGVPGNGWYGYSNETLNQILKRFHVTNPGTQTVAIAYGMWDGVGMAVKLGSGKRFEKVGVGLIRVEEGVRRFLDLMDNDPGCQQVVVTSRLWEVGLTQAHPDPALRFMDKVVTFTPGVELIARTHLSLDSDPYLKDHCYNGTFLFPTVFGMEAMAQAALVLTGNTELDGITFTDLLLERPIPVSPESGTAIEIRALLEEQTAPDDPIRLKVSIHCSITSFEPAHFSATLEINSPVARAERVESEIPRTVLKLKRDIYSWLLFHGPRYQRLREFARIDASLLVFNTICQNETENTASCFGPDSHRKLVLGDPFYRDSLLQSAQVMAVGTRCLPIHVERWEILKFPSAGERRWGTLAPLPEADPKCLRHRLDVLHEDGTVVERLVGYRSRILERKSTDPGIDGLVEISKVIDSDGLAPVFNLAREVELEAHKCGSPAMVFADLLPGLAGASKEERHRLEKPFLQRALRAYGERQGHETTQAEVVWAESGKPQVAGMGSTHISITHTGDLCLCVIADRLIGCDLEAIEPRNEERWNALLGPPKKQAFEALRGQGLDLDAAGTTVWSMGEAFCKALESNSFELSRPERSGNLIHSRGTSAQGDGKILAVQVKLPGRRAGTCAIAWLEPHEPVQEGALSYPAERMYSVGRLPDGKFFCRWPVTFIELANPRGGIYFAQFSKWQGQVREFALWPITRSVIREFKNGAFAMVTNQSETCFSGEARIGDVIEANFWLKATPGRGESSIDLFYEWFNVGEDSARKKIATSTMRMSWVKVKGHGLVEPCPFPDDFRKVLETYSPDAIYSREYGPDPFASFKEGHLLFESSANPLSGPLLAVRKFTTALQESNLVGNIYFSNYSVWQGRARDNLMQDLLGPSGLGSGEFTCVRSKVQHLREAMPFDEIEVSMSLKKLCSQYLSLEFAYFRQSAGKREKIAIGEHQAFWTTCDRSGRVVEAPLPSILVHQLLKSIE